MKAGRRRAGDRRSGAHGRTPALLLLAALAGLGPGAGAQAPPATFQESVDVVEVLVEVAVTDRRGTPVHGLELGDFVVEEDGVAVEIVHVESLAVAAEEPVAAAPPLEERQGLPQVAAPAPDTGRNFIILMQHLLFESDITTLGATSRKFGAVRDLRRWLAEELGAGDCVAVLAYDSRLEPVLDFSNDRQALDRAIRRALMDRSEETAEGAAVGSCPRLFAGLPPPRELRDRTPTITDGIATLAEAAGRIDGRKHLLLFSLGVGLGEQRRAGAGAALSLSQTLNANKITAYTMDLTPPRVRHSQEAALQGLARNTGGSYYGRSIGFFVPLEAVRAGLEGSYRIAFRSRKPAGATGYREIEVQTVDSSLRVSSQRGYLVRETRTTRQ